MTQTPKNDDATPVLKVLPTAYAVVTPAMLLAADLAARLRAKLSAAGFDVDRDFPHLRGDTTVSGEPFLALGRLRPWVVEMLIAGLWSAERGVRPGAGQG